MPAGTSYDKDASVTLPLSLVDGTYWLYVRTDATGGVYEPKACTSIQGAEGVCLSGCIPQVQDVWGLLPQADCRDDERCVPCVNPIDGMESGAEAPSTDNPTRRPTSAASASHSRANRVASSTSSRRMGQS